jgi:poly(beta-D-mannuronate) lyase
MFRKLTAYLVMLSWVAPAMATTAVDGQDLARYRVTRPGEVLFDPAARSRVLAALSGERRRQWCGSPREHWRSHKAKTRLKTPADDDEGQTDDRAEPFVWTIMTAAAVAFGEDDAAARRALIGNLHRWADGKALTKLQDEEENTYYTLNRTLLPTIVAYSLIRDDADLPKKDRDQIERWLNRLVRLRGIKRPEATLGPISLMNNHRYLSDSVDMAWGALRGDDTLFRQGIESFLSALSQMRADGSLPLEVARGSKALWYQRQAIASLVTIAEMAAVQGYDLYAIEIEGRSLHQAIDFLAQGVERPEIVLPYARANRKPGEFRNYVVQDRTFMVQRGHERHYMAWIEAYRARFPTRAAMRQLVGLLDQYQADPRPMIDEFSGGNMTCFFALPDGSVRAVPASSPQRE